MGNTHISRKPKGKVLSSCIIPPYLNGPQTMAMTDKQQGTLQVCESNWVRKIAGVKRIYKRRLEELREDVLVKESLTSKEGCEEPAKAGRTRGKNGRGTIDEESGYAWSGG